MRASQFIPEGRVKELAQDLKDKTMSDADFEKKYSKTRADARTAMRKPASESVAGPKNCWPGYRKTGTQPGTGKNAGKRVNDCEKIKEQGVAESSLEEISRRDLLKGAGAAALAGAAGSAVAQSPEDVEQKRREHLQRMQRNATGPTAGYAGRVVGRIKPNLVFTGDIEGNPRAEVEVRSAPDGMILSRRIVQSSGNTEWDNAVLRAIDRTQSLPKDTDGYVPPVLVLGFRPNDTNTDLARRLPNQSRTDLDDTTKKVLFNSLMLLYFSQYYKKHQAWEKHKNEIVSFADANKQQDYVTSTYAKIKSDLDILRKSDPTKWNNFAKQVGDNAGPTIQSMKSLALSMTESSQAGVAENMYSGTDDTVGFSVNSEAAYQAVMARFGDSIDHDETSGIMYVPERMWPQVEVVAFDADGEGAVQADGLDEGEKIGGRHDADDFDDMVLRLKKLAGAGPMKTVYDPQKRVYKNMPTAQQPAQQPKK